jgi:hypothetical protein
MQQLFHIEIEARAVRLQSFDGQVDAQPAAELESVGHALFRAIDPDRRAVQFVLLYTLTPGSPLKPKDADGRESQSRSRAPALKRKIHSMWDLCRQFVEGEGRDEGDHALRDLVSYDDEVGIGQGRQVGKTEEASHKRY